MAAYGAVVSLMNLIEWVLEYNNAPNKVFDNKHLTDLKEKVLSLKNFLETYSNNVSEDLECRIADGVHVVEDQIESHILVFIRHHKFTDLVRVDDEDLKSDVDVEYDAEDNLIKSCIADDIRALCVTTYRTYSIDQFSQVLQELDDHLSQVLQELIGVEDCIKKEASKIEESASQPRDEQHSASADHSHKHTHAAEKDLCGDASTHSYKIKEKLLSEEKTLQIFSITGMGGIGKTTLAESVYCSADIRKHFDVLGWVTISEKFTTKDILIALLEDMNQAVNKDKEVHEMGKKLHQHLVARRYLIIIDDIWSVGAWNQIRNYLNPLGKEASRIIVTTRDEDLLGDTIASGNRFKLKILDENESWSLLERKVFCGEKCPQELVDIGKSISVSCMGLPLLIDVIGGLLAQNANNGDYWESIKGDIIKRDVKIRLATDACLGTSYHHLPVHLKPCFLYFGAFPEDCNISVSDLIYLWVARGFLKADEHGESTLEDVGYGYLSDLVQRNLVIVSEYTVMGRMKSCKIHDLLRDLCLREVKGTCDYDFPSSALRKHSLHPGNTLCPLCDLKPLRVWKTDYGHGPRDLWGVINARYLQMLRPYRMYVKLLWNVQTINAGLSSMELPSEIWEMPQLRHLVKGRFFIIEDPRENGGGNNIVLRNLQTLKGVYNFRCSEVILKKIPNLKKLKVFYYADQVEEVSPEHVKNLGFFKELESLSFHSYSVCPPPIDFESKLGFSASIRELRLELRRFNWEDMGRKIGLLPKLEKLELKYEEGGEVWNADDEEQFPELAYLFLSFSNLKKWTVEDGSLRSLKHLVLWEMREMEEIPTEIGYIVTMKSIGVYGCKESVVESAKSIEKEQHDFANEGLQVQVASYFDGKKI